MASIERYVTVDEHDHESDYEYATMQEAIEAGEQISGSPRFAVVERHYVYDDSELVWTSTGATTWPPKGVTRTR